MKYYKSARDLAAEMKVDPSTIDKTFREYNEIAEKMKATGGENGPYDAYGGGKTYDKWGKKFFHNLPVEVNDTYHVAVVTPVIHYCMGGLKIDGEAQVLTSSGKVIE